MHVHNFGASISSLSRSYTTLHGQPNASAGRLKCCKVRQVHPLLLCLLHGRGSRAGDLFPGRVRLSAEYRLREAAGRIKKAAT